MPDEFFQSSAGISLPFNGLIPLFLGMGRYFRLTSGFVHISEAAGLHAGDGG